MYKYDYTRKVMSYTPICLDIESNHAEPHKENFELWGLAVNLDGHCEYHRDRASIQEVMDEVVHGPYLSIFHNGKFDIRGLRKAGVLHTYDFPFADTFVGLNLCDENLKDNQLGLKPSAKRYFGAELHPYCVDLFCQPESENFADYAKNDVLYTLRLWKEVVLPMLENDALVDLFFCIYMRTVKYLADMEDAGIQWDFNNAAEIEKRFYEKQKILDKGIRDILGIDIDINSPKQLIQRMFHDLHYDISLAHKTDKGNVSVDSTTLENMRKRYPVAEKIIQLRNCEKMRNTYLRPQTRLAHECGGRIHPSFWQTTLTGRKRSSKPNFQNQPVIKDSDLNIRNCAVAEKGTLLIVCDLSQAQLRGVAHVSQDRAMMDAYLTWQCTACRQKGQSVTFLEKCPKCGALPNEDILKDPTQKGFWHGLDIHQLTADATDLCRKDGKSANFALCFGANAWKMDGEYGGGVPKWEAAIDKWFSNYIGVKAWHDATETFVMKNGFVKSPCGRLRRFTKEQIERASRDRSYRKHLLNQAYNAPIQALEGHYLSTAVGNIRDIAIKEGLWRTYVKLVLEVHDEIVFQVDKHLAEDFGKLAQHEMRYALPLKVPMDSDLTIAETWGEAK